MATGSVIGSFTLEIDELGWTGQDLHRPESVVAEPDGTLWVSDGRGGVTRIDPEGGQVLLAGWGGEPNGLAIDPDGNLVTANIGLGMVQRMTRDGQATTVLQEVDGQRTTSANFVFYDRSGRLWLTCLVLQPHFSESLALSPVTATSARLVSTPPQRPAQDPVGIRRQPPPQHGQEPADLRHAQRHQQLGHFCALSRPPRPPAPPGPA
jgi:hypothetical protein